MWTLLNVVISYDMLTQRLLNIDYQGKLLDKTRVGIIAQDIHEAVSTDMPEHDLVDYGGKLFALC